MNSKTIIRLPKLIKKPLLIIAYYIVGLFGANDNSLEHTTGSPSDSLKDARGRPS